MAGRREELIEDIAARLKRVCAHMSVEDFQALVRDIADIELKYEGRATPVPENLHSTAWRAK